MKIGEIDEPAGRTIDATGKLVTPGFIDVHTHFDAQVFWDNALTPSPLHGVTTALAGNCGFTVAPLSDDPADGDYLTRMLARVEGMPLDTLRRGVPFNWKSTGDYLDRVEQGGLGINLGFMVGHSAIRRVAMGPDATARESTPEELERMKALLRAGLEAGGLGLSSSYCRTHNDDEGHMVPSRYAATSELVELARVAGEFEGTGLEIIPQVGPKFDQWAVDLMTDMSVASQRPDQLERHDGQRRELPGLPGQARGRQLRPRARRQDRRPHHADQLRRAAVVREWLRARRHARLGGPDAVLPRREAAAVPRQVRS